jgi:hypothetical protein
VVFHEFAMGLQTDTAGNFYYAKAARHALQAVVPQHGTLLRVSKDGTRTDILATGFRAPNGVCVNPNGTFFLTDQEGFWVPKNRIDLVERGGYYGNFWGYHDVTDPSDAAMKQPVCWITNAFDRSVRTWSLKRSQEYGSRHYNEKPAKVIAARVSADGKAVTLQIEDLRPTPCMEIQYDVKAADGSVVKGTLHNTIHRLAGGPQSK